MKILLIKPVKVKDGWMKAGDSINATKKEAMRLMGREAAVEAMEKAAEDRDHLTDD